jgi:hypothetical protein
VVLLACPKSPAVHVVGEPRSGNTPSIRALRDRAAVDALHDLQHWTAVTEILATGPQSNPFAADRDLLSL